ADDPGGLVGAAGVMFFAFLGFDRITTPTALSAQWRPRVVLPLVFAVALGCYLAVGLGAYRQLGAARLALSPAPLRDTLVAADAAALMPVVAFGAAISTVPVLLLVLAGTRRRLAAMGE